MKKGVSKAYSTLQKDINRLRKTCISLHETIRVRNLYIKNSNVFIDAMLKAGKITKEDLKPYFKKKREVIKRG